MSELEKSLNDRLKSIGKDVIDYVKSQKDIWQKIPWLALQADGRGGYNSMYGLAYEYGLWSVSDCVNVDLVNGDLVYAPYSVSNMSKNEFTLIPEIDASGLVCRKNYWDAKDVISYLKERIEVEDTPYCGDGGFRTNDEWRASFRRLGFTKDSFIRF